MVQNKYVFDPYPLSVTMQRLAENLKARRLEKKLSTRSLSEMSGVPASSIQRFELKHSISLESYVKLAKALGYSEEILQLLSEPKYDTMEELLEINKNRKNSSSVVWLSMSMPKIWMTMHVISALSSERACGL